MLARLAPPSVGPILDAMIAPRACWAKTNRHRRIVDISTHLAEALGYRPEELLGQHVNDVLAPRSAIRLIEDGVSAEVWRTGVIQDVPIVYQHRDGHAISARVSVYVDEAEGVAVGVARLQEREEQGGRQVTRPVRPR